MSLPELAKKQWFLRVWNRLGFPKEDPDIKEAFANRDLLVRVMKKIGLGIDTFETIVNWEIKRQIRIENKNKFWTEERLMSVQPIGKYWHFAYTVELDKYSFSLPQKNILYSEAYLMGREKDIEMVEIILTRPSQNSILLVGEPGVGKGTLVDLIAEKIKEEKVHPILKYKRIVEIELDRVVADFQGNDLIQELHIIFQEAAFAGNVILVINNIQEFLSREGKSGIDITSTLVPYLALPTFQIIGISTSVDFHAYLEKNASIMKYFDKIIINELSLEETRTAMLNFLEKEEKSRVLVSQRAIEEVIKLADQYVTDSPMPEKAIDILEEVLIYWSQSSSDYFVTKEDVDRVFSDKIKIPLGEISQGEQERLINLEAVLKKRVIGQNEIIKQIGQVMIRARSGVSDTSKPIGSFLFLGSTGVGKTETAKALAESYFGSDDRMIRLDMSEYQTADSIGRILGNEKIGKPSKFLSEVSENPFSVLLLDEIEKAYPEILNLFLQILDEGWLTDAFGRKVIFKNMIIIATSNAGAEIIKDGIESGYSNETIHKQVIDYAISSGIFRPEFLNRFENVLFFKSLEGDELVEVTRLILKNMAERIYKNKNIKINFGEGLIQKIIKDGYNPIFGARSIKHFVQDKIEDVLAKKIVEGEVSEGEEMELKTEDVD
ncbi:MAG TPA: AAA family ATPase [Patescibacteria group bacterium]